MSSSVPDAPSRVSREAVGRAVDALLKWMRSRAKQRKAQLLEHDDVLYLVLTLKKIPSASRVNPFRIPLPHPLFDLAADGGPSSLFLIADDRPKSSRISPSAALARARAEGLPVSDCVGLSALGADFRPFEARRRLCDSHDLFFADRAILPLLPRLLGKHFFRRKKIPLPLDLSRPGWPQQLKACLRSTFFYLRSGTCSGLKVGRVSMDREKIVDNVVAAIEGAVGRVPNKWANVRSFHVKAVDSLALPVYQAVPEMGFKIDVPVAWKKSGYDDVEMEEEEEQPAPEGGEVVEGDAETEIGPKKSGESKRKRKNVSVKKRIHEMLSLDPFEGNDDDDAVLFGAEEVEEEDLDGWSEEEEGDDEAGVEKDEEVASVKNRNKKGKKEDANEEEGVTEKKSKKKDERVKKAKSNKIGKDSSMLSNDCTIVDDAERSVDDGEEEKEGEERGTRRKREKAKKGKPRNSVDLLFSDEGTAVAARLKKKKKKSKTKN